MEDDSDHPVIPSAEAMAALLERSRADVAAGRTVPLETVLADLDASIARMEARRAAKVTDAA